MLFSQDSADGIRNGTITVTFRSWTKPQAKPGGKYRTWGLLLQVDQVSLVDPTSITNDDAQRSGAATAQQVRTRLARHEGSNVYRVEFRCIGQDDRLDRRQTPWTSALQGEILRKLARMDQSSRTGPWTRQVLTLISSKPGTVSTDLALLVRQGRPAFKQNVRKLKELGLTESLEVGYQLSPLGRSFVAALAPGSD